VISGKPSFVAFQTLEPFAQIIDLSLEILAVGIFSIVLLRITEEDPDFKVLSLEAPNFLLVELEFLHLPQFIVKPH
jgi:hypothetical protein